MNIPAPLVQGELQKESTFRKINEIIQYLNASRLRVDGTSVSANETSSGMILSASRSAAAPPSGGEGYAGYFKVKLVEDNAGAVTVSVVNGANEEDDEAGYIYYNGVKIGCSKISNISVVSGFLCLSVVSFSEITYQIKNSLPDAVVDDDGVTWYPLAEIIGPDEDGGWYTRQIHQGGIPGAAAGGSETSAGYAGYFKLYLIKTTVGETTTYKVRIADGATYNSETGISGGSLCRFGKTEFLVADEDITVSSSGYIYLVSTYDSGTGDPGIPVFEFFATRKTHVAGIGFIQIGRVVVSGDGVTTAQDSYGYAQGFIFGDCGDA